MIWQNIVPIIGNIIFAVALIPSIRSKYKPHKLTCAMTASVLFVYAITFWSINMWYWSLATLITATAWTILFFQGRKQ